jgi:hypothetical protein
MQRVAIGLVLLAGLADAAGGHRLAFYLLVVAVPAISAAALGALGAAFEPADSRAVARAWLQTAALGLVLVSAAARAPFRGEGVPRLAISALVVCVLLYAAQGAVVAWPHVRRRLPAPRRYGTISRT